MTKAFNAKGVYFTAEKFNRTITRIIADYGYYSENHLTITNIQTINKAIGRDHYKAGVSPLEWNIKRVAKEHEIISCRQSLNNKEIIEDAKTLYDFNEKANNNTYLFLDFWFDLQRLKKDITYELHKQKDNYPAEEFSEALNFLDELSLFQQAYDKKANTIIKDFSSVSDSYLIENFHKIYSLIEETNGLTILSSFFKREKTIASTLKDHLTELEIKVILNS